MASSTDSNARFDPIIIAGVFQSNRHYTHDQLWGGIAAENVAIARGALLRAHDIRSEDLPADLAYLEGVADVLAVLARQGLLDSLMGSDPKQEIKTKA